MEYEQGTTPPQIRVVDSKSDLLTKNANYTRIRYYDVKNRESLILSATETLKDRAYDGVDGSLTTWLDPFVSYGTEAIVEDPDYPNRSGTYFITEVNTTLSSQGAMRQVFLSQRLA